MTNVHSYLTVHVRSARLRPARRRATKYRFLFFGPANQRLRLGAAHIDTQRRCGTHLYIARSLGCSTTATTRQISRRGESALHGNAVGVSGEAPGGDCMIPMSTAAPGAALWAMLATRNE